MNRTKLSGRALPSYTRREEIFHMVSHIVGGAFGLMALALCVLRSVQHGSAWSVVSSCVYGGSIIMLYTMSALYHGLKAGMAKKVLQVLDHCTIYYLIAGTYTPVVLCRIRAHSPGWGWALFAIVWGCAALATIFTAIDLKKYSALSMACYLGMGWSVVIALKPTLASVPHTGLWWILSGGIAYTLGAVLYGIGKKRRWMHAFFHLLCVIGTALQFIGIYGYVI